MHCLADTSTLTRAVNPTDRLYGEARRALVRLWQREITVCVVPQVLYELWAVCTRPIENNGLGMSPEQAGRVLLQAQRRLILLPDPPTLFAEWFSLVRTHGVSGKKAHDARLVAVMRLHGIGSILTYNGRDFARFPDVRVLEPGEVGAL